MQRGKWTERASMVFAFMAVVSPRALASAL